MLLAAVSASPAWAHAFLDHAEPAVGSVVHGVPQRVELWFSQDLEAAFSSLKVVDRAGKQVDRGDKSVPEGDKSRISVGVTPLAPGTYRVYWRVLSADTHVTSGDFSFEVAP
jgi:hypothetical protein